MSSCLRQHHSCYTIAEYAMPHCLCDCSDMLVSLYSLSSVTTLCSIYRFGTVCNWNYQRYYSVLRNQR